MSLFITFEGIEGCGKSTQSKALKNRFARRGIPVLLVKEPGSTAVGKVVRQLLKHKLEIELHPTTELLLFEVARAQLISEIIQPTLKKGINVICDRYGDSTLAYQGYGRGLDLETIDCLNKISTGGLSPAITFLPDLGVEEGLKRKGKASAHDRFEREKRDFHQKVREGYLQMAKANPDRWLVVDGTLPRRTIGNRIWYKVQQLMDSDNNVNIGRP